MCNWIDARTRKSCLASIFKITGARSAANNAAASSTKEKKTSGVFFNNAKRWPGVGAPWMAANKEKCRLMPAFHMDM